MQIQTVDVETLHQLRTTNPKEVMLIDVREEEEWNAGHIPGAHHIPKGNLIQTINSLSPKKETPIYLQCRSGGRSQHAAEMLLENGYTNVFNVIGGIMAWEAADLPIV